MDVSSQVYGSVAPDVVAQSPPGPAIFIDEEAELARPRPAPLREPHLVGEKNSNDRTEWPLTPGSHPAYSPDPEKGAEKGKSAEINTKHESFLLSGSTFLVTNEGKTLSLPIPSESKMDPLNWCKWKRAGALLSLTWYSVVALTLQQAVSVMLPDLQREFAGKHTGPWTVEAAVTAPSLFMGIGCFVWIPLSLALGRRPVFLIASLINFLATLGAGFSRSLTHLIIANCIFGFCEGFALSAVLLMVIDMTFIDQRPRAIAALWSGVGLIGVSLVSLAPLLSNHGHDWDYYYRWWSIMTGSAFVFAYLAYPETYFKRPTVAFNGLILLQTATEKLTIYKDLEADSELYRELPPHPSTAEKGFDFLRRIGLARSPFASWRAMGTCYFQMVFCFVNPLIFWLLVASAINFSGMIYIGATYFIVLSSPPYSLPFSITMHVNNFSALGSLLAYPLSGLAIGKLIARRVRRNRGVLEAEHYLIAYVVPVLTGALSTLLYGLAVHRSWSYPVYYLAYGLNGLSWVSLSIANTLWVTEAFPRWAAPALAVVGGGCYVSSFLVNFALLPWIKAHGFLLVGVELMVLQLLSGLVAVPIAFWGKSARQRIHGKWAEDRGGALRPL